MLENVITVTPDKDGRVFITLFGTKYEIVIKDDKPVKSKKDKDNVTEG